jgi:hypothetical protein
MASYLTFDEARKIVLHYDFLLQRLADQVLHVPPKVAVKPKNKNKEKTKANKHNKTKPNNAKQPLLSLFFLCLFSGFGKYFFQTNIFISKFS